MPCNKKKKKEKYMTSAELKRWADKVDKGLHQSAYELWGGKKGFKKKHKLTKIGEFDI